MCSTISAFTIYSVQCEFCMFLIGPCFQWLQCDYMVSMYVVYIRRNHLLLCIIISCRQMNMTLQSPILWSYGAIKCCPAPSSWSWVCCTESRNQVQKTTLKNYKRCRASITIIAFQVHRSTKCDFVCPSKDRKQVYYKFWLLFHEWRVNHVFKPY